MALGTDYIIRYLSDISGAVQGAKQLETINSNLGKSIQEKYGQAIKSIGQIPTQIKEIPIKFNGKDAMKTIQTVGEVVQTANGSFLQLGKTQTFINGTLLNTSNSVKNVTDQFVKGNLEAAKGSKIFTNFGDNVKQLAGRAILTIPIWIALRAAIMGFFSGITGGIKDLIAFDLSLQKIRNNMSGTASEVDSNFKKIRNSITEASKATGISTEELAKAVKEFATLGFSANESLQGALGASKLSIALFGDAGETAGAFARALNIMIDRSKGAKSAIDQMNEAFALTSQLEETNNFEIKMVTEALDKFAGTAAGVGLTMNQTLAILAALGTAGRRGSEGATLLSTSFNQLLANIPKITKSLGLVVNAGESTFVTFRRIIDEITRLNNTPGGKNSAIEAMGEIFGGARGIKIVQSLVAVKDILDKNIATLPSFAALNVKVERTINSESKQAEILGNNIKEMGKSFITAVIGSEDFTGTLIILNNTVKATSEGLNGLGSSVRLLFTNFSLVSLASSAFIESIKDLDKKAHTSFQKIVDGLKGQLSIPDLTVLIEKITLNQKPDDKPTMRLIAALRTQLQNQMDATKIEVKPQVEIAPVISFAKQQEVAKAILGFKLNELKLNNATNAELIIGTQAYTDQLGIVEELIDTVKRRLDLEMAINEENNNLSKIQKSGLIENQLEFLKLQGATQLQIIQQRIELEKMYNVSKTREDLLRDELNLNKAITEEKINQNKVSSDSVKLFEISKKFGIQAASTVANFLSGKIPVTAFEKGGRESDLMPVLKEFFSAQLEQMQAAEFFFKGRGAGIPIPERQALQEFRALPLEAIKIPPINTTVGNINVEIKKLFKQEDTAKQIMDSILEAIRNDPSIESAINEKIDNF
jgi:TP901 family phage tail tape measure protein